MKRWLRRTALLAVAVLALIVPSAGAQYVDQSSAGRPTCNGGNLGSYWYGSGWDEWDWRWYDHAYFKCVTNLAPYPRYYTGWAGPGGYTGFP